MRRPRQRIECVPTPLNVFLVGVAGDEEIDSIGERKKIEKSVRRCAQRRLALLRTGLMAEAVLTPRHKDLETGIWTRAAPLTEAPYCKFGRGAKQKVFRAAAVSVVFAAQPSLPLVADRHCLRPPATQAMKDQRLRSAARDMPVSGKVEVREHGS